MGNIAIRTKGLGKRYRKGMERHGKLIEWLLHKQTGDYFWALKDITFEVRRGETLGIVGHNGAGKSTLLKILSRITLPNEGYAEIHGCVGSLLNVGTGFHPELTGRENVYLNGALIGMPRAEIRERFDEIVDFAEIEEFIDTPLKRYSSGMKVRLGFAIAVNLQQEIMLVDEVLSVGDVMFREKCLAKMEEITGFGRTVLFVGHNLAMISASCNRAIWLERGKIRAEGDAIEIVRAYGDAVSASRRGTNGFIDLKEHRTFEKSAALSLTHIRLLDENDEQVSRLRTGAHAKFAIGYESANGQRLDFLHRFAEFAEGAFARLYHSLAPK